MNSRILYLKIILIFSVLLPIRVAAYTFAPNLVTLRPVGSESSAFFRLNNKQMKAVAIEIVINECHKDIDGKIIQCKEAEEDFIVYPAQIVLMPGEEVGVQVRWIGEPDLTAERTYTIVSKQVPIPQKADEASSDSGARIKITVLINYEARIYVLPKGAKPEIVVESAIPRAQSKYAGENPAAEDASALEIICSNKGTAHKKMRAMSLILTPVDERGKPIKNKAVTLTVNDVPGLNTNLLAGGRRRFIIPWPAILPHGPINAILTE